MATVKADTQDKETGIPRDKKTKRYTDKQSSYRQTITQTNNHTDKAAQRQRGTPIKRHTDKEAHRQRGTQTKRHKDKEAHR